VVADFDNDGLLDLFVTNANAEPYLYHNVLPTGAHWLELELEGRKSNRDAVGTKVWVTAEGRRMLRFVDGGNGFAAQSTKRIHAGLGGAATAELVEVEWPSGLRQSFAHVAADHIYRLVEGEPALGPGRAAQRAAARRAAARSTREEGKHR
jgi:hypothetical protein